VARGARISNEMRGQKAERKKGINEGRREHSRGDDGGGGWLGKREPRKDGACSVRLKRV
jgi:hypothetical protein